MAKIREISLQDFAKEFGQGHKFLESQKKTVIKGVYEGCLASVGPIAERSPVDTGAYASAWKVEKKGDEEVIIGNTVPYAIVIELGSEPFKAPIGPLLEWTARVLQKPVDDPEVKKMAWAVKKKIEKYGMEPKHILEKAIKEIIFPKIKEHISFNFQYETGKTEDREDE